MPPWLHTVLALFIFSAIILLFVIFVLLCLSLFSRRRAWRFGEPSCTTFSKFPSSSLNVPFEEKFEEIDVDRIVSRRQGRYSDDSKNDVGVDISGKHRTLEKVDNDTATVLAVEQLLDTSFLISDEELACYMPTTDVKVVASCRNYV